MKVKHLITPASWSNRGGITALEVEVSSELINRILFHMTISIGHNSHDVKFSMDKGELKQILEYK